MRIGSANTESRVALVAEVGNNHEGSIVLARDMIEAAFECGADAVKLQTFVPELYVSRSQTERLRLLERFRLADDAVRELLLQFGERGLTVFSTPFDVVSLDLVASAPILKISSGDINYVQLLDASARKRRSLILSTGASFLSEVAQAVEIVEEAWKEADFQGELALLHCVSAYPASSSSANLRAISTLQEAFPTATIGYSDHTVGIDVAATAVALGARIVEKHFTLDKGMSDFRDHMLSADPQEFRQLRDRIDVTIESLGDGVKQPQEIEFALRAEIRRSVTAARALRRGQLIRSEDLCIVRPGRGLAPESLEEILGRVLLQDVAEGEALDLDFLK